MPEFILTPEQNAIIASARIPENSIWSALAGAAKTSTLTLFAQKLPLVPTLCCAFNKKIADEMTKRMPAHITCKTMNALGHAAWGQKIGKRLTVKADKLYTIFSTILEKARPEQKKLYGEMFSSLLRAARLAKSNGYVPQYGRAFGSTLTEREPFLDAIAADLDVEPTPEFAELLDEILSISITSAFEGVIDFDDQIYMSVCFSAPFPTFPIILVDEAQDLSPMNHEMIRRMYGGRLVVVGDPFQAIYGFRGAHSSSMSLLKEEFSMKEYPLNVSFRCPISVVERARWRAPHMAYPDWARPGKVEALEEWGVSVIPADAAIICRSNAPLFSIALRLIRAGRGVEISKGDIGKSLITILRKFGKDDLPHVSVLSCISEWENKELSKAREARHTPIHDKADCLRVFADAGTTLGASIAFATHLFEATGSVKLMTGHKAKGLEFPVVFHLDPQLIPSKYALRAATTGDPTKLEQEYNVRYVIETRAQDTLYLVESEAFRADA
jgi:hypothetical protein